jgi:DNA topoisomerase IB
MSVRVHRVDPNGPGLHRRKAGRGFSYVDEDGHRVDDATRDRIQALVIPPAWTDVWISPDPQGHIQAMGVDAKGRRQYRYHDRWREERDRAKHDRVVDMAQALPNLRRRVTRHLRADDGPTRRRVLAAAVRLLERGLFRVGGEEYASDNDSYGLATLRKRHVKVRDGVLVFDYPAKSGQRRCLEVDDPDLVPLVEQLKRRTRGGNELLAYKDDRGRWRDVRSDDVNDYLREALGEGVSAKDLRTWGGTVLAAVALAAEDAGRGRGERGPDPKVVTRAVQRVARQLGNTPAVARSAYVDPRVIARYEEDGTTVDLDDVPGVAADDPPEDTVPTPDPADVLAAAETAVVDLLDDP